MKILVSKPNKKSYHQLYRTNTTQSSSLTEELFDEVMQNVHSLCNNCVSQIVTMNSSMETRMAKLENQWISTKKQLDIVIELLSEKPLLCASSSMSQNYSNPLS